jgi:hypothetical protein
MRILVSDWVKSPEKLLVELLPIVSDYCAFHFPGDRLIELISYDDSLDKIFDVLRLNYDVMLTGDENIMEIILDKKGKRFSQR